jgi:hypothetical protein
MFARINENALRRSRSRGGGKKRAGERLAATTPSVKPSPLYKFVPEFQKVAETMVELVGKPSAADPADIDALTEMFHAVDGGMWAAARQMADRTEVTPVEVEMMDPIEAIFADASDRRDAEAAASVFKGGWYTDVKPVPAKPKPAPKREPKSDLPPWPPLMQPGEFTIDELANMPIKDKWVGVTLKVHVPEPEPIAPAPVAAVVPSIGEFVFDEEAIAAMFANLAANGMTLADLSN